MIDFSDVLGDPELGAVDLVCMRSAQSVNTHGRAVNVENDLPFCGIVTQDKGAILNRIDASAYVSGSILVTTAFALVSDTDVVVWNGARYAVETIFDYGTHGVNWAICVPDGV
jgi:galactose-6-phosphate isomerase